jgi:hypothetical protein
MKVPILGISVDERFLTHRLRSTSIAGVITGVTATLLFAWHFYVDHIWSWDLLAVALTFVTIKMGLMLWFRLTD